MRAPQYILIAVLSLAMLGLSAGATSSATDSNAPGDTVRKWGKVSYSDWADLMGLPKADLEWTYQTKDVQIVEGPHGDELRQRFVPNSSSNKPGTNLVQAVFSLPPAKGYRISQEVLFEDGWVFGPKETHNQLGKVGLGVLGGSHASGGSGRTDGFSSRFMWYPGNTLSGYFYHADRAQRFPYGDQESAGSLKVGTWHTMTMEVVANSSKHTSDGELRIWLDGKLTVDRDDLQWQDSGHDPRIDRVTYASFFGGWGSEYAPTHTTYARFRNFEVAEL